MDNRRLPALIALAGIVVALVVLLFVLKDDTADQDTEIGTPKPGPAPQAATIDVKGGEPVGGAQDLEFTEGERIRIKVSSDTAGEVHLHGYDVTMDVAPGKAVEFDIEADIGGVFELELEETAVLLAEVSVVPS